MAITMEVSKTFWDQEARHHEELDASHCFTTEAKARNAQEATAKAIAASGASKSTQKTAPVFVDSR